MRKTKSLLQRAVNATIVALACALPCSAQNVSDFSTRANVAVPAGSSIVRVALPPTSLAAMRSVDSADIRVLNASGALLPFALINAAVQTPQSTEAIGAKITALPIYAPESTSASTPTLRIEEGPKGRVIEYSGSAAPNAATREARGLLFDTRSIEGDVRAVDLTGVLPVGSIVKLSLDASTDLKTWRTLASDAPVFDFGPGAPSSRRVVLASAQSLKNQYVRLTWSSHMPLAIDALQTVSANAVVVVPPLRVDLGAPSNATDEAVEWTLSSGLRASAMHLQTSAANALMPVRVLTRARAGDPWRLVMSTVVYRLTATAGSNNANPSVILNTPLDAQVRVEPHAGYRLSGVPLTLALEYPPLHAVFVASGTGPFVIASGKPGLASAALPIATVMPGYLGGAEYALPVLQATKDAGTSGQGQGGAASSSMPSWVNKSTLLWTVLVFAVLVLGGLAVSLLRAPVKK
ncbi:MAG: DUF3999 family protein [Casimicrobium sp.]